MSTRPDAICRHCDGKGTVPLLRRLVPLWDALSETEEKTVEELAEEAGASAQTTRYRLKVLQEHGLARRIDSAWVRAKPGRTKGSR